MLLQLFEGKLWPIHMGGGIGLGMGLANCSHAFKDPYNVQGTIAKVNRTFNLNP